MGQREGSVEAQTVCSIRVRNVNDCLPGTSPPYPRWSGRHTQRFLLSPDLSVFQCHSHKPILALYLFPTSPLDQQGSRKEQQKPAWGQAHRTFEDG